MRIASCWGAIRGPRRDGSRGWACRRRRVDSSSNSLPTSPRRSPIRTSSVCSLSRGAAGWVAVLLVHGRRGGCAPSPPQTTLSRAPLGHSCEPRDFSLPLRRSSPEDTGLGRERTPRTALSARQRPESAPPLLLVGIRWKCEVSPRGEAGGVGGLPPRPVSSGEPFRRRAHPLVARESGHAEGDSAWSRGKLPGPARRVRRGYLAET